MVSVECHTFEEIAPGMTADLKRVVTRSDLEVMALSAGDFDVFEVIRRSAREHPAAIGVEGAGCAALVASVIGSKLPGAGTVIVHSDLRFRGTALVGDELTASVTVREKQADGRLVTLECRCVNQSGQELVSGTIWASAPADRSAVRYSVPEVSLRRHEAFTRLLDACARLEPVSCAVAHPCDHASLVGAIEAAQAGFITPVLVGPEAKIRAVAEAAQVDLTPYRVVDAEHSHAAAEQAVALARGGEVEALMKGSLHTDELMAAVVSSAGGLRTARRVSHVFAMDVPAYGRPLLVTDAAINIEPTLEDKRDIVQNAIELAQAIGIPQPKVAILSAVETVNPKMQSTLDAAALCKMADRGQITGGILDGPLAFDNAISLEAAKAKHIVSAVAGQPDILLVPNLEAGNMLAKQMSYFAGADSAGIVLGARVPIVLTSRADNVQTRLASAALMALFAHARRSAKAKAVAE